LAYPVLDRFYPERTIVITSADPEFVTLDINYYRISAEEQTDAP